MQRVIRSVILGAMILLVPMPAIAQEPRGRAPEENAGEEGQRPLVAEGVRIWTRQCIRCHNVRSVRERGDRGWTTIMAHMRARANLTEHQRDAVLAFLQAMNEPPERRVPECRAPTPEQEDEGAEIYRGEGNCIECHGEGGRGGDAGPPLSDGQWSRGSGEYSDIVRVVTLGAPGMPAMGGAELTDAEICAVSAYVYSISH